MQDIDVSTPAARSVLVLGTLSYLVLLTMLMGGMYLAIDATAGERERGSLEPLLTVPVPRAHLIYGKILATCAYMLPVADAHGDRVRDPAALRRAGALRHERQLRPVGGAAAGPATACRWCRWRRRS